jgi:hypothetical protein
MKWRAIAAPRLNPVTKIRTSVSRSSSSHALACAKNSSSARSAIDALE